SFQAGSEEENAAGSRRHRRNFHRRVGEHQAVNTTATAKRVINFNAGPAGLPLPALERARDELLDFAGTGMSIMEHSHRGKAYEAVHAEAKSLMRELVGIPDAYEILFVQGGASQLFAQIPMNFVPVGKCADYVVTGAWSEKAVAESKIVSKMLSTQTHVAAQTGEGDGKEKQYHRVPEDA